MMYGSNLLSRDVPNCFCSTKTHVSHYVRLLRELRLYVKPREELARNTLGRRLQVWKHWQWNNMVGGKRNRGRTESCVKDEIGEVQNHQRNKKIMDDFAAVLFI